MQLGDFDYALPDALIARFPPAERRASRLLVVDPAADQSGHENGKGHALDDREFADFPSLLRANDLLVFNDTRVIKARLHGHKASGGKVEILIERQLGECEALAHVRASKTPQPGSLITLANNCSATVVGREKALTHLQFDRPLAAFLDAHGEVPLPPYLQRNVELSDEARYQTVYAREPGAVAAPTAGLHFDEEMMSELAARNIRQCFVTLHVGAGTFQNLREDQVSENRLHSERVEVSQAVCDAVTETRENGGRVVAIGTTSVRALESAGRSGTLAACSGETELFIRPGYSFRIVDAMLTNFHLPKSSLLMLVAAFGGTDRMRRTYRHAVAEKYRFFSYGDAMLIQSRDDA